MGSRRISSCWLLLIGILFLLRYASAQNKTDIPNHVNMSPFWGWISAAECLLEYQRSSDCIGEEVLTLTGVISVDKSEADVYCKAGRCGDQTKDVLDCIHSVKRDFHFANKAKVSVLYNAITDGCKVPGSSDISTANYTSSSVKLYASCSWVLLLSMVALGILLISTNMI